MRIWIRILIRFRSHDHITESQFSDAAAIFYITLVRDAITMVFLNCSSCYSFFSGCKKNDDGGFWSKWRRISSWDHVHHQEKQGLLQFSGLPNHFCMLCPTETGSYCLLKYPTTQQFLHHSSVVLDLPSCPNLSKTSETRNLDSLMNADLKPARKQVCNPDSNPHYTRRVNAITHINLGFNAA